MESSLLPDIERLGAGRRPTLAGRLLLCANDLEPEEDEQLEGGQSYAETNKTVFLTNFLSPERRHRQIHTAALA
jgi:hypothetical protein